MAGPTCDFPLSQTRTWSAYLREHGARPSGARTLVVLLAARAVRCGGARSLLRQGQRHEPPAQGALPEKGACLNSLLLSTSMRIK